MYVATTTSTAIGAAMPGSLAHSPVAVIASTGEAVIKLLREGLNAMEKNKATATACIQRAYALLESEQDRPQTTSAEIVRGGLAPWQIRRAIAFIDANLEQQITNFDLAPSVRLSPHYFARAFKQSFGVTPHAYIYQRRLEQAQALMLTTDEPLCQIARSCGFADQAHFTRRFRLSTGDTPHAWRRAHIVSYRAAA